MIKNKNSLVFVNNEAIDSKLRSGCLKTLVRNFTKLMKPYTLKDVIIPITEPRKSVITIDKNMKLPLKYNLKG